MPATVIYTIGHSTHSIDEFIGILKSHAIELIVDVRTIPKSRRNPQFNSDTLAVSLKDHGIGYLHIPGLGGLRHAKKDSLNLGWQNTSFRGFADYMHSEEFEKALQALIETSEKHRTAIMCAEAVPWRCHRSLISDALLARGIQAMDIMSRTSVKPHTMTPWAVVDGTAITYPAPPQA